MLVGGLKKTFPSWVQNSGIMIYRKNHVQTTHKSFSWNRCRNTPGRKSFLSFFWVEYFNYTQHIPVAFFVSISPQNWKQKNPLCEKLRLWMVDYLPIYLCIIMHFETIFLRKTLERAVLPLCITWLGSK